MNDQLAMELIGAVNRLSTAVEQAVLTSLDGRGPKANGDPYPAALPVPDEPLATLPPMHAPAIPVMDQVCPVHKVPWKVVPAGVSKKTGNPYDAFRACPTAGCTQRPAR